MRIVELPGCPLEAIPPELIYKIHERVMNKRSLKMQEMLVLYLECTGTFDLIFEHEEALSKLGAATVTVVQKPNCVSTTIPNLPRASSCSNVFPFA